MVTNLVSDAAPAQAAGPGTRPSALMRAVNTSMRAAAANAIDPIAFFCECRTADCFVVCWLTRAEFDAHSDRDASWLLSDRHEASEAWQSCRPVAADFGAARIRTHAQTGRVRSRLRRGDQPFALPPAGPTAA